MESKIETSNYSVIVNPLETQPISNQLVKDDVGHQVINSTSISFHELFAIGQRYQNGNDAVSRSFCFIVIPSILFTVLVIIVVEARQVLEEMFKLEQNIRKGSILQTVHHYNCRLSLYTISNSARICSLCEWVFDNRFSVFSQKAN